MISRLTGKIVDNKTDSLCIENGGVCYDVFVPGAIMKSLEQDNGLKGEINLITYHYYQLEPSRAMPISSWTTGIRQTPSGTFWNAIPHGESPGHTEP